MDRILSIPVGVVAAHEKIDNPWQDEQWRPLSVFLIAPESSEWRELRRGPKFVHYHVATLPLELHPKETLGYVANLTDGGPSVYVVMHHRSDAGKEPIQVHLVTASAYEAQAYGHSSEEIVGAVAMPEPLIELLQAYVAEHHEEKPFIKRQRKKHHIAEEHNFGQEPIDVLRERRGPTDENR